MRGFLRRALVGFVVAICLAGVCAPGGRMLAAGLASRIVNFHPSRPASLKATSPLPFILDVSKKQHASANRKALPAKAEKRQGKQNRK